MPQYTLNILMFAAQMLPAQNFINVTKISEKAESVQLSHDLMKGHFSKGHF